MNFKIYKIKDWKMTDHDIKTLQNGRQVVCVEIGRTMKDEPLEEWIYADLLQEIETSVKDYKIITRVGQFPQLAILNRSKLVIHNEDAREYNSLIRNALGEVPMKLLTKAFTEIRLNAERYSSRNYSTNAVISIINDYMGLNMSTDFVYAVMMEYLESQFNEPVTELEESVHYADYEDLISYACDAVLHMDSKCEDSVIEHFTGNEVIQSLGKELVFRLLTGEIHQR